jgi:exodeoxyribonuclease VII large subunit
VNRALGARQQSYQQSDPTHGDAESPLSVSELVALVTETLETNFADILVAGELTSFKRYPSGHCYLTLADPTATLNGVMFRGNAVRLTFEPRVGDEILCRGRMSVYDRAGRMQLQVSSMRPIGAGAAQRAMEELRRRLAAEGLFDPDRKRPLPFLPATVGVVTSRSGAAIHDIVTTIRRRFSACRVILSPAAVQGEGAPGELVAALALLRSYGECDVLIVGRGGGASEDLSAFNDERVVRALAEFPIPTVSAVGHETDVSLCDLVADLRAATPTAAAEAVVPVQRELETDLDALALRLKVGVSRYLTNLRHRIGDVAGRLREPGALVASYRQRSDELFMRLERALVSRHRRARAQFETSRARVGRLAADSVARRSERLRGLAVDLDRAAAARVHDSETRLAAVGAKLSALSPLAVLDRGYSLASRSDGRLVRDAAEIEPGDALDLRFARGRASTRVIEVRED